MSYTKTLLIISFMACSAVNAQVINTEVSLSITSTEFQDGIAAGETGDVNISITNLGPNPISSDNSLGVTIGYNVTQDIDLFFEFVYSPTNDSNCNFVFPNASPRPPVDDISYFFYYDIATNIEVGATYTCTVTATFEQPGELETVWRMFYTTGGNTEVVSFPFTFRGQALPVPLNLNIFLMTALILLTAVCLKGKNH